jgi:hypothetical protein
VHSRKQILFILAPDFCLSNPRRRKRSKDEGRPLHIVCTTGQPLLILITAYQPRLPK